jgi:hypothetical protein
MNVNTICRTTDKNDEKAVEKMTFLSLSWLIEKVIPIMVAKIAKSVGIFLKNSKLSIILLVQKGYTIKKWLYMCLMAFSC